MRFNSYLTEMIKQSQTDWLNALIKDQCKPYLKLIKNKMPLYRGFDHKSAKWGDIWTGEKNVRKDRKPKGTNIDDFKRINNWLEKNGHNRRDKSISCISDKSWASGFSSTSMVYYIFPIGKINYTWIESKDFNRVDDNWDDGQLALEIEYPEKEYKKSMVDLIHTNKGFNEAYTKRYEIWFNCKSYYYMNASTIEVEWDYKKQEFI